MEVPRKIVAKTYTLLRNVCLLFLDLLAQTAHLHHFTLQIPSATRDIRMWWSVTNHRADEVSINGVRIRQQA